MEGLQPDYQQPGALFRAMLDVLRTVHYDRETGWNRFELVVMVGSWEVKWGGERGSEPTNSKDLILWSDHKDLILWYP